MQHQVYKSCKCAFQKNKQQHQTDENPIFVSSLKIRIWNIKLTNWQTQQIQNKKTKLYTGWK